MCHASWNIVDKITLRGVSLIETVQYVLCFCSYLTIWSSEKPFIQALSTCTGIILPVWSPVIKKEKKRKAPYPDRWYSCFVVIVCHLTINNTLLKWFALIFYRTTLILIIKCLKSTEVKITAHFHRILEGCVGLYYHRQGQRFERATKCIMHTSIWPSPMRCEKKQITQHLRLWHSSKSTCAGFYSSIYSQMPFPKGLKEIFFFFFRLCGCVSVSVFPSVLMKAQTLLR